MPAQLEDGDVARGGEVEPPEVALLHVVDEVLVRRVRGSLALQLEDHQAVVVPGREQVLRRVRRQHPEALVLALVRVHARPARHGALAM